MVKKTILLLVIVIFSCSTSVLAHDGVTNFAADKIAPTYGMTGAWIDYQLPGYTNDPARYIEHNFVWEEKQGLEAYEPENAFEGLDPSGMEIDLNFYGYDDVVWGQGAYSEDQDSNFWYTDMPYGYIDTSFDDNDDEPTIGLGSGYWFLAQHSTYYYATSYLKEPYTAEKDDFKVTVSRTHFHDTWDWEGVPIICSGEYADPWCRFEDGYPDKGGAKVVPSWTGSAPGSVKWSYPSYDYPLTPPQHNNEICEGITCTPK